MGTKTPWNTLDLARILRPLSTSWQTQNLNISYRRPVLPAEGGKVGITLSDFFSWTLPRCAYGFLMNFSGLPEQSVAMLSFWLREKVRFIESSGWGRATELTLYVFGSMTVIVLVTICLVACDFLLYVLFQMDTGNQAQTCKSVRNWRRSGQGRSEEATIHRRFPEGCRTA